MSGGEKKKRTSRGQGWEEAKDEFYQESYPTDVDFEALERDPKKIATLLPSKQNRGATGTRRLHKNGKDKSTAKRRASTKSAYNTVRRQSINQENHFSMMPDLSENLSNEETTWEQIMAIKAAPISLSQKKEMKAKLQSATKLRLQGYEQFKWKKRKFIQRSKAAWEEVFSKIELWHGSLKKLEGHYGTGVVTYFQFIKWLIFLNIAIFLFLFLFVILPSITLDPAVESSTCLNSSWTMVLSESVGRNSVLTDVLNFIQGTGWMGDTLVFFGTYDCSILQFNGTGYYYNLPFAYILVSISVFIFSLVCIVKSAARGFRERLMEGEGQYYQFCNLVFGGWDFCIQNEKSANMKHKAIYNEIKSHLLEEKLKEEVKMRSGEAATKLMIVRGFIHCLVLVVLAGSATLIYYAFSLSKDQLDKTDTMALEERLLYEYLPSITIVALNTLVPFLLRYFVTFEKYSPIMVVRMTLLRTVFLRLASLLVLIATLYSLVACEEPTDCCPNSSDDCCKDSAVAPSCCQNPPSSCKPLDCWETYVGQNFYKLVILDFATHIIVTFFINFPRSLIAKHCRSRFAKVIGEQEFELPKHVLDVVYSQCLCWLGLYFAPILPAMVAVELAVMFYIKKFICLVNCKPSSSVHLASRSKSLFMLILLVGFIVAAVPVGLSIGENPPSKLCGPFRGSSLAWEVVLAAFQTLPQDVRSIIFYFGTAGFAVPAFIVLALALYYFYAVTEANKHMVAVLRNQLVLEGHDKQFLLNRLSALVKQQEQGRKHGRSLAPNPELSSVTDNSNAS